MDILMLLIVGGAAGWLGSMVYKGGSMGIIGNIVVGIIGSYVGYWILDQLGISFGTEIVGAILTGAIGSVAVLFVVNVITKRK